MEKHQGVSFGKLHVRHQFCLSSSKSINPSNRVISQALDDAYSGAGSPGSFVKVLRFVNPKVFEICGSIANNSLKTGGSATGFVYVARCEMPHCWSVELKERLVTIDA